MKALCEFGKNFITKREIKSWYKKLLKEKGGQQTIRLILNYEACSPNDLAMAYIGKEDNSFITIDIKQLLKIGCDRDEIKFIIAHELAHLIGPQSTTHEYAGVGMEDCPAKVIRYREIEADYLALQWTDLIYPEYVLLRRKLNDYLLEYAKPHMSPKEYRRAKKLVREAEVAQVQGVVNMTKEFIW